MRDKNFLKNKTELLAPAGSPEKLKYALAYGADAVYCGIPETSMRARINEFTEKNLKEAVEYVHKNGKKIFVTINIYAHNYHLAKIEKHLKYLSKIGIDGVVVSDLGVLELVKKYLPKIDIHLSTQANTTNWQAAKFWYDYGVKRIVLAREVTLEDIREIHKKVPKLELEYFVHGAMCMSYSGRCILSKWMSNKSANLGDCSQPCRWAYKKVKNENKNIEKSLTMSVEDTRGEHQVELEEDLHGTYFFNSKDLNLIRYVKELRDAGVTSFKIEGRNKSVFYVATAVRAYRNVLSAIEKKVSQKELKGIIKQEEKELDALMNRGYTQGFLLGNEPEHNFSQSHSKAKFQFVGEVLGTEKGNLILIKAHNAIYSKDKVEIIGKEGNVKISIEKILDEKMQEVVSAHGGQEKNFYLQIGKLNKKNEELIKPLSLLRKMVFEE
ncbi:MAG: hypothetical protein ACD_11C00005G0005 [uncultured bacterium]|nr:MAG: hypothetical protein ACD_11C00005G0005 [uncultured bacterium]HBR71707.1 peptidase U32 [Candidatus Moranbacteria bacterium]